MEKLNSCLHDKLGYRPLTDPLILDRGSIVVADQDLSKLGNLRDKLEPENQKISTSTLIYRNNV